MATWQKFRGISDKQLSSVINTQAGALQYLLRRDRSQRRLLAVTGGLVALNTAGLIGFAWAVLGW